MLTENDIQKVTEFGDIISISPLQGQVEKERGAGCSVRLPQGPGSRRRE